jgi:hypothetical protein
MGYLLTIVFTMLILPVGAIILGAGHAPLLWLTGKWFVFWAVGVRLMLAGMRQYLQPEFTSRNILGIESADAFILVRELGGANLAAGVVGLASLIMPSFVLPSAIGAGIFYAVAGVEHVRETHRSRNATIAMVSDFFAAFVLLGFAALTLA